MLTLALAIATSTVFAEGRKHSEPHTHDEAKENHEAHSHGKQEKHQEHEGHNHGGGVEVKVPQGAQKLMGLKTAVAQKRSVAYSAAGASNAELASQLTLKRSELEAMLAGRKAANGTVDFVATENGVVEAMSVADGAQVSAGDQIVTIVP